MLTGQHPFDERSALEARDAGMRPARRKEFSRGAFKPSPMGLESIAPGERHGRAVLDEFPVEAACGRMWTALLGGLVALILAVSLYFALHGRVGGDVSAPSAPVCHLRGRDVPDCPTCPL